MYSTGGEYVPVLKYWSRLDFHLLPVGGQGTAKGWAAVDLAVPGFAAVPSSSSWPSSSVPCLLVQQDQDQAVTGACLCMDNQCCIPGEE